MGKRKLFTGMIVGAILGGLTAITNKEARDYAKEKLSTARSKTSYFIKNPSDALNNTRTAFERFNESFASGAENTINALDQIEQTVDKLIDKDK